MTYNSLKIRKTFLEYFQKLGHEVVPSSPLVPKNDPTLLFANSGMVQFKNLFTGLEHREYTRATTAQKCVRAGGKHNDLENVGYTARHHTFFEMLGNFSFGDYFKEFAIEAAWNLITKEFQINKNRLYITVYSEDDEAKQLWKKIAGLSDDRIIPISTADNFWSMGDTGPCGPCSEIFYDHGDHIPGGPPGSADADGDRFIEIWNLVFMQFEQLASGEKIKLPKPSIDTGMGLERVAAVLNGNYDNYETDILKSLILASAELTKTDPDGPHVVSHRVIADHLRSSSFLIADGVLPSNEGRGYVLRRIMRRAMRHAHLIGSHEPLMWKLVATLQDKMGESYPELGRAKAVIEDTLRQEEARFKNTLDRGLKLLAQETADLKKGDSLKGDIAFKLYDTYGFPLDLTQDALRREGYSVDETGFNHAMAEQKALARKSWTGSGESASDQIWLQLRDKLPPTEFLGYTEDLSEGQVIALVINGQEVSEATADTTCHILTNQTPFYAESGGQMGDTGVLFAPKLEIEVQDTVKSAGDFHIHVCHVRKGTVKLKDIVSMQVDHSRRQKLRANHSATHLLDAALRKRFGNSVTQKGSLVSPEKLRFDFSLSHAVSFEDQKWLESEINRIIRTNTSTKTEVMPPEEALAQGAIGLFGEKYGEEVRVVTMGTGDEAHAYYSRELCGGTHVKRTGDIGLFKITSESSVSAGVRRLEAVTGEAAMDQLFKEEQILWELADQLKSSKTDLSQKVSQLMDSKKNLEKEIFNLRQAQLRGNIFGKSQTHQINGVNLMVRDLKDVTPKDMRPMMDQLKKDVGSGIIALFSEVDGKVSMILGITSDLIDRYKAGDMISKLGPILGGSGGGRPDMAQSGGDDPKKIPDAIEALKKMI